MRKPKKDEKPVISTEKMAILAEKGLKAAKLTKEEKQYLLRGGLKELYNIRDFTEQTIPPLESEAVEAIMNRFFPEQPIEQPIQPILWIRMSQKIIEIVMLPDDWDTGSPAFAHRGKEGKSISFHKNVGKITVHLKILRGDERLADIHARLTDNGGKSLSSFEAEIFKGGKCIETVSNVKHNMITFFSLEMGDYVLRISDLKGEITSIAIKLEQ